VELERLQVVIEASIAGYKDKVKKVKEITGEATKKVSDEMDKIKKSFSEATKGKTDASNLDLYKAKIKETEETLTDLKVQSEKAMNTPVKTASMDKYSSKIKEIKEQLAVAYAQMDHIQNKAFTGISEMPYPDDTSREQALQDTLAKDKAYQKLSNTVNKLTADLETQNVALAESASLANKNKADEFKRQKKTIAELEEQLKSLNITLDENLKKQNSIGGRLSTFWDKLRNSMSKVNTTNKAVKNSTKSVNAGLKGMNVGLKNSLLATNPLSKSIFRLSNMFKLMVLRMVMRKAFNAILAGFKDLAKANAGFNSSMSTLQSGFLQARNALSTAFAPALKALTPLITNITNSLINAMNVIGMFTSRLFGNTSTFIKAKQVTTDYAKSLGGTADAAKKAQGSLAGFDEINTIGSKNDGTNESGLPKPEDMFEEIEIPSDKLSFLDSIKAKIDKLLVPLKSINFENLNSSFENLKKSVEPITKNLFSGLEWAYFNILVPFSEWGAQYALPGSFNLLAAALGVLNSIIEALKPSAIWLYNEFLEPFGQWAGDKIIEALDLITEKLDKFSKWVDENQELVQKIALITGAIVLGVMAVLGAFKLISAVTTIITTVQTVIGLATAAISGAFSAISLPVLVVIGIIALLVVAFIDLWKKSEEFRSNVTNMLNTIAEIGKNIWETILKPIFDTLMETIDWLWTKHLKPLLDNIWGLVQDLIECVVAIMNGFILPLISAFVDQLGPGIANVVQIIVGVVGSILGTFSDVISGVITVIRGIVQFITGVFSGDWKKAWTGIVNIFKGIFEGVGGIIKGVVNVAIDLINGMMRAVTNGLNFVIKAMNKLQFTIPDWVPGIGGQTWGINIPTLTAPTIPKLAQGAVIPPNSEFLAILGDQKSGTNIETPERLLRQIVREELGSMAQGGGDITIENNMYLDGDVVFRNIKKIAWEEYARSGESPLPI
jgi:hypothetical protein